MGLANTAFVGAMPRKFIAKLGERYVAGHSIEEGLKTIQDYLLRGALSTFDILGESARDSQSAQDNLESYLKAISIFAQGFSFGDHPCEKPVSISVKPSAICGRASDLPEKLEEIVEAAGDHDIDVTLDMEDYSWVEKSLDVAGKLWKIGYENLGIVLQSRLYRTEKDIKNIFGSAHYPIPRNKIRVRACIGAYEEKKELATNKIPRAKEMLVERIKELLAAGVYVEIATHDKNAIRTLTEGFLSQIPNNGYEFQFLKGVPVAENELFPSLRKEGYTVRFYMPVEVREGEGAAYMKRRLMKDPHLVRQGIKTVFGIK